MNRDDLRIINTEDNLPIYHQCILDYMLECLEYKILKNSRAAIHFCLVYHSV